MPSDVKVDELILAKFKMKNLYYNSYVLEHKNDPLGSNATMQPSGFSAPNDQTVSDADLEKVFPFLDSPIRPATPDLNDPNSMAIYEEHKQLTKEYFKVQSEIELHNQKKNRILDEQLEEGESLSALQNEYESLVHLKNFLFAQKELNQSTVNNIANRIDRDGWEVVSRTEQ